MDELTAEERAFDKAHEEWFDSDSLWLDASDIATDAFSAGWDKRGEYDSAQQTADPETVGDVQCYELVLHEEAEGLYSDADMVQSDSGAWVKLSDIEAALSHERATVREAVDIITALLDLLRNPPDSRKSETIRLFKYSEFTERGDNFLAAHQNQEVKDEFCEWRKIDSDRFETSCADVPMISPDGQTICGRCDKPVKLIEGESDAE